MIKIEEDQTLMCPRCGGGNLHHTDVVIYDRHEDGKTGLRVGVTVTDAYSKACLLHRERVFPVTVTSDVSGNPSPRRCGIRVVFSCETCDARPMMVIYQHKGSTGMEWENVKLPH